MALVGLLGHSMANGHSGAKGTQAQGPSIANHSVAGAFGRRGTWSQGHSVAGALGGSIVHPYLEIIQFKDRQPAG